jgi:hypothetical protein
MGSGLNLQHCSHVGPLIREDLSLLQAAVDDVVQSTFYINPKRSCHKDRPEYFICHLLFVICHALRTLCCFFALTRTIRSGEVELATKLYGSTVDYNY